jgi:hypothetical protein
LAGNPGISGSVDGAGTAALLNQPVGIAVDESGTLYVSDTINNTIRRIVPSETGSATSWIVTTIAGLAGAIGSQDGVGSAARFNTPIGLALGATGAIYVADAGNGIIREGFPAGQGSGRGALTSLSSRAFVGTGDGIMIGGFYVSGGTSRTVLIQAIGPSLEGEGIPGSELLRHPELTLKDAGGRTLFSNIGWSSGPAGQDLVLAAAAAKIYAQPVLQTGSDDSELLVTLPPGAYTALVSGADGGTGVALCSIYELP